MVRFLAAAAVFGVAMAACAGGESASSEPDRVVNVVLKCTYPAQTRTNGIDVPDGDGGFVSQDQEYVEPAREFSGQMCVDLIARGRDRAKAILYLNARNVVTVRTESGSAYTVEAPADTLVSVGDAWPLH